MKPLRLKIISYNEMSGDHDAVLLNGDVIKVDPYVGLAINEGNKGQDKYSEIIGNDYYVTSYQISRCGCILPDEGHMIKKIVKKTRSFKEYFIKEAGLI